MPEVATDIPDTKFFGQEPISDAAKSAKDKPSQKQKADTEEKQKKAAEELKTFKLSKPIQIADQTYEVLSLDFSKLSAKDLIFVEAQARSRYNLTSTLIYKESGFRLLAILYANKIPFEDVECIPWPEAMQMSDQALYAFTLGD
jgi:hypothetical protein